jgi:hypothetical protein
MASDKTRNVFVAVGSTAVSGLIALLNRLKQDGIYDQKINDIFIGIDTDSSKIQSLKNIDRNSEPIRIHGIQLTMPSDSPELKVVQCFDPDWKNMGGITASGVGGDRRLSFTSLNWTGFWDDIGLDDKLGKDDRVILLGSAFGGTSTGLYWNMAEYIAKRVRSKVESLPGRTLGMVQFFGMLLLPEGDVAGGSKNKNYPIYRNFCHFMQDMQVVEWRNLLDQKLNVKRSFRLPLYSAWEKDANAASMPVFETETFKCTESSNLPMETLFLLPTPNNAQGLCKLFFAEAAFTLFYLNLSNHVVSTTVDMFKQKTVPEEMSFGGFNMIVARSASNAVLRDRYYGLLEQNWKRFWNGDLPDGDEQISAVCALIEQNMFANDEASNLASQVETLKEDVRNGNLNELRSELPIRLADFAQTACNVPYKWSAISTLIKKITAEGARVPMPKISCLAALVKGYQAEYESMQARAASADNVLESITANLGKAARLQGVRGKSKVSRLVNGVAGAKAEVASRLKEYLVSAIDELVDAHRAAVTLKTMPRPQSLDEVRMLPDYASAAKEIDTAIRKASEKQKTKVKGFVSEAVDNELTLDVMIPGLDFSAMFLELLTFGGDASVISTTMQTYEAKGIDILRKQVEELQENNPLKKLHTQISADDLNSYCADVFRAETPGKGILHFCYVCGHSGNVDWPTWGELRDGLGFSSFARFPGAGADNARAVLDASLQGPGENQWFYENHLTDYCKSIQGVWLGTLDLNHTMKDVLQASYRGVDVEKWEKDAYEAEANYGADRYRLMGLREMIYLGVSFGAIEKKVLDAVKQANIDFNAVRLNLSLNTKKGTMVVGCKNGTLAGLGFSGKNSRMTNVSLEWISKLMKWIADGGEEGFCKNFSLGLNNIEGKLLFERNCVNNLKLQMPPDCLNDIETLFDEVYKSVEVGLA